jgi:hypothetical protein
MRGARVFFGTVALIPVLLQAQTSDTRQELWPEADVYVNVNSESRFYFSYSATRESELSDYANGQVGGYYDFYMLPLVRRRLRETPDAARDKFLMFRVGYAYSQTPPGASKPSTQQIPTVEADPRAPLPWDMLLTDRNRLELRIVNGDFEPEYRNRLRLERSFRTGRFVLTPYTDVEAFYSWKYHAFDEVRYTAGLEWQMVRFLVLEGYYTRQRDTKSLPQYVNALGLTLQLHLRQKQAQ